MGHTSKSKSVALMRQVSRNVDHNCGFDIQRSIHERFGGDSTVREVINNEKLPKLTINVIKHLVNLGPHCQFAVSDLSLDTNYKLVL
jgi:hypothetical protein